MSRRLRIALVAPVAVALPPQGSRSVALLTSLLAERLVARGHDVTLFATADSTTTARLHATHANGYEQDPAMWPWQMFELLNIAAAVERAAAFDLIHYQADDQPFSLAFARVCPVPLLHTVHHWPAAEELALWRTYPDALFTAVSDSQAQAMTGLTIVGVVPNGIDVDAFPLQRHADDGHVLFVGRFTEGKGAAQAVAIARQAGMPLVLAGPENGFYRNHLQALVDGRQVIYAGAVEHARMHALYGRARALLYPVQQAEPFGLVLAEAMACGTPVAALDRGAVAEVVTDGVSGGVFESVEALAAGLPAVCALARHDVRADVVPRLGADRMAEGYEVLYARVVEKAKTSRRARRH